MTAAKQFVCVGVVLLSVITRCIGIQCFYCNSANNSACVDVNKYDDEERLRIIPVVVCETAIPSPVAVDFFCRKIVQTIYHPYKDSELRVTRGCGWIPHDKPCYQTSNRDRQEIVCGCRDDYCNQANENDSATPTIMFLALALCLYFYRL